MKKSRTIVALILLITVLIFAIQNTAIVAIQFLFWEFSVPRSLLVMLLLGIGFGIGLLASSIAAMRKKEP